MHECAPAIRDACPRSVDVPRRMADGTEHHEQKVGSQADAVKALRLVIPPPFRRGRSGYGRWPHVAPARITHTNAGRDITRVGGSAQWREWARVASLRRRSGR